MSTIALLTTEGDAHACGLAHGRRFAREIADNVATYLARFAASGLDRDQAFAEAVKWRRAIETLSPAYGEEMRGIAEGSGQSADTIALLNARGCAKVSAIYGIRYMVTAGGLISYGADSIDS